MMQKVIFKLKCIETGNVKGHGGAELHGLFFNIIKNINSNLAEIIHENEYKPFAIGPLRGKFTRKDGLALLNEGDEYSFSIATLSDKLTRVLPQIINFMDSKKIYLNDAGFEVVEVKNVFPNPLSYFELMTRGKKREKITLNFTSPTCFRQNGSIHLLPDPNLVFGGLHYRWNLFSDVPLPEAEFSTIQVSKYSLKTSMVKFNNYNLLGFRGECTYSVLDDMPETFFWVADVLASFASIAGVGYKTTMGMGHVRKILN